MGMGCSKRIVYNQPFTPWEVGESGLYHEQLKGTEKQNLYSDYSIDNGRSKPALQYPFISIGQNSLCILFKFLRTERSESGLYIAGYHPQCTHNLKYCLPDQPDFFLRNAQQTAARVGDDDIFFLAQATVRSDDGRFHCEGHAGFQITVQFLNREI